mgnify:CR=1 FL=1
MACWHHGWNRCGKATRSCLPTWSNALQIEWLASIGQREQTRRVVWNPLAQWLTGNDLSTMSADALRTLDETLIPQHSPG